MNIISAENFDKNKAAFYMTVEPECDTLSELIGLNRIFVYCNKTPPDDESEKGEIELDVEIDLTTGKSVCTPLSMIFYTSGGEEEMHTSPDVDESERGEIERICSEFIKENFDEIVSCLGNDNLQFMCQ